MVYNMLLGSPCPAYSNLPEAASSVKSTIFVQVSVNVLFEITTQKLYLKDFGKLSVFNVCIVIGLILFYKRLSNIFSASTMFFIIMCDAWLLCPVKTGLQVQINLKKRQDRNLNDVQAFI